MRLLRLRLRYVMLCARVEFCYFQDSVREFTARCWRMVRLSR